MDEWVSRGIAPPPSCHPRVGDGTAVPPERTAGEFERIPETQFPRHQRHIRRLDFGAEPGVPEKLPPEVGQPYPSLVPSVDADGNETAGVRLPDVSVPSATHTGWNTRHPDTGGAGLPMRMIGSTLPFAATRAEREAAGDPRPSIEERYGSREEYLDRVAAAARALVEAGWLLPEDLDTVAHNAAQRFDRFRSGTPVKTH